jgi:hypothetical protein
MVTVLVAGVVEWLLAVARRPMCGQVVGANKRGPRERCRASFRVGVVTEATTQQRGDGRRAGAAAFGGGEGRVPTTLE